MSHSVLLQLLSRFDEQLRDAAATLSLISSAARGHGLDTDIAALLRSMYRLRGITAQLLLDEAGPPSPCPQTRREGSTPPGAPPPVDPLSSGEGAPNSAP